MERIKKEHFKKRLLEEKDRVERALDLLKHSDFTDKSEIASELSFYDNHPADLAAEINDIERGRALKSHEVVLMKKINSALESIEREEYGTCKMCGKEINEERLDFIPYAEYCIECQNNIGSMQTIEDNDRPLEEDVLQNPFGYGFNDFEEDDPGYDAEDSYQEVESFNRIENIVEYYEDDFDVVEPIERISNSQYIAQLPD